MRDFLNSVLAFIDSESLTDEEFDALPSGLTAEYTKAVYDALKALLIERESISTQGKKLKGLFVAKGVDLTGESAHVPRSNIFFGSPL